jgi:hypothetical protein
MMKLALALLAPTLLASAAAIAPIQAGIEAPEVGKPAPTGRLNDHTGALQTIGGERDEWMVIAFFPKAMTPG